MKKNFNKPFKSDNDFLDTLIGFECHVVYETKLVGKEMRNCLRELTLTTRKRPAINSRDEMETNESEKNGGQLYV